MRPRVMRDVDPVLDAHWAVRTIDGDERRELLGIVDAWWASAPPRAPLDERAAQRVSVLATACDLAALEEPPPHLVASDAAPEASARQRVCAATALHLLATLPLPDDAMFARELRLLHLAALGVVADQESLVRGWIDEVEAGPRPPPAPARSWDHAAAQRVARIWRQVLLPRTPSEYDDARARLARLREDRAAGEASLFHDAADAQRSLLRFRLFTLYHLADAAGDLLMYLDRGHLDGTPVRLDTHFTVARAAAIGESQLPIVITWLHAAAAVLIGRRSDQLALPGLER